MQLHPSENTIKAFVNRWRRLGFEKIDIEFSKNYVIFSYVLQKDLSLSELQFEFR